MKQIAIIGYGKQGQRLAKKLFDLKALYAIYDPSAPALQRAKNDYPKGVVIFEQMKLILSSNNIDGVAVAVPTPLHFEVTKKALQADKAVMVEKPITKSRGDAEELVDIATIKGLTLMVGHSVVYSEAMGRLERAVAEGIQHIHLTRTSPNGMRFDDDVLWRLASHDVATLVHLLASDSRTKVKVASVGCTTKGFTADTVVANFVVGKVTASLYVSWANPQRIREVTMIQGGELVVVKEDGLADDPLMTECEHFLQCMETGDEPKTDGEFGLEVVKALKEMEAKL